MVFEPPWLTKLCTAVCVPLRQLLVPCGPVRLDFLLTLDPTFESPIARGLLPILSSRCGSVASPCHDSITPLWPTPLLSVLVACLIQTAINFLFMPEGLPNLKLEANAVAFSGFSFFSWRCRVCLLVLSPTSLHRGCSATVSKQPYPIWRTGVQCVRDGTGGRPLAQMAPTGVLISILDFAAAEV